MGGVTLWGGVFFCSVSGLLARADPPPPPEFIPDTTLSSWAVLFFAVMHESTQWMECFCYGARQAKNRASKYRIFIIVLSEVRTTIEVKFYFCFFLGGGVLHFWELKTSPKKQFLFRGEQKKAAMYTTRISCNKKNMACFFATILGQGEPRPSENISDEKCYLYRRTRL